MQILVILGDENVNGTLNFVSSCTNDVNGESFVPLVMLGTKFFCTLKFWMHEVPQFPFTWHRLEAKNEFCAAFMKIASSSVLFPEFQIYLGLHLSLATC